MRMVLQLACPGVEDAKQSQLAVKISGPSRDVLKGGSGLFEEEVEELFLMSVTELTQLLGQGECDKKVGHRKNTGLLFVTPASRCSLTAFGTGTMLTGMVGEMSMTAGAVIETASPLFGSARENGPDCCFLRRQDLRTILLAIGWPMPAQHRGKFHHRGLLGSGRNGLMQVL